MAKRYGYTEGDWFGVPLPSGGFALGRIARISKGGLLLAYLFGPRRASLSASRELTGLAASDALMVKRIGDAPIVDGVWPVVHAEATWERGAWPLPLFGRVDPLVDRGYQVQYVDDDPNSRPRETVVDRAVAQSMPDDGVPGPVLLERMLDKMLA